VLPNVDAIQSAILFLAPGFIALKLFSLFGAQRPRSQFEWTIWSVLASLPLAVAARAVVRFLDYVDWLDRDTFLSFWEISPEDVLRFGLAVLAGLAFAWLWKRDRAARLREHVADSAWDWHIEWAYIKDRRLRVVLVEDGKEVTYRGWVGRSAREDTAAEPWLCLKEPERQGSDGKFARANAMQMLVRRDKVQRVMVYRGADEPEPATSEGAGAAPDPGRGGDATPV
jgi:hypothetical protein